MRLAVCFLALAACYLPDKQDCTDGRCGGATDAMPADEHATLVIMISGPGSVAVEGVGTCDHDHGCTFDVPAGTQRSLVATPTHEDKSFDTWSGACAGQPATCALVPTAPMTTVGVRFE